MSKRSADQIVQAARNDFSTEWLTETGSVVFDEPLINHLRPDEELAYLFFHTNKGLRIIHPDGTEQTPDHNMATSGKRFLLITDQGIVYVAGDKDGDTIRDWDYANLIEVAGSSGFTHSYIRFHTRDGMEYKFADDGLYAHKIENAAQYVEERIKTATASAENEVHDTGAGPHSGSDTETDTAGFSRCPACHQELPDSDANFCSSCGTSL